MNPYVRIACAVMLFGIVTAAGVGLLVQHRKLDELRMAHAGLAGTNRKLAADHAELVSANGKLADELRALRDVGRACVAERATIEQERTAWKNEREGLKAAAAAAGAAQARAEREVADLKAAVKDLTASVRKLREERDGLKRELCEAMESVPDEVVPVHAPASASVSDAENAPPPITPAPPDTRTPEERAAHEREELKDLIGL